jgi:hypothetical protein
VRILSSIISGLNFFIKIWKFYNTPTANLLFLIKAKRIGRIYSLINAGERVSIKATIFYERAN